MHQPNPDLFYTRAARIGGTPMPRGFTLVELMVSIAIALVLILGVNQVFKIGAQTVGAGQAFSEITRDERTAHIVVYTDIHNAVTTNQPALLISSQRTFAFRNQQDFVSEPSGVANTITINNTPQTVSDVLLGPRNYRIDTLGFFASGDLYHRQTADAGYFVSPLTSSSAWIWYGHLTLPNNDEIKVLGAASPAPAHPDWFDPGSTTGLNNTASANNDNNLYASEWILGRIAMVLFSGTPSTLTAPNTNYISATAPKNPLAYDAVATDGRSIFSSRYDLVTATMSSFNAFASGITTAGQTQTMTYADTNRAGMMLRPNGAIPRYEANPYPVKPLTAVNMAAVAPIFLQHCSQFIVEYAGDYLTQDNNPYNADGSANLNYGNVGTVTNPTTKVVAPVNGAQGDGVVDFVIDPTSKANNPTNPGLWTRKIRWYGFPRDTNGDGAIKMNEGDVVPLRDVLQAATPDGAGQPAGTAAPWEAFSAPLAQAQPAAYDYATATPGTLDTAQYLCSWGSETVYPLASGTSNGLPRMLRITLALDDPNGRLAAPQIYEYVIDLGAQQ